MSNADHYLVVDSDSNVISEEQQLVSPDDAIEFAHRIIINDLWCDYEEGTILAVHKSGDAFLSVPVLKFSRVGPRRTKGRHSMKLAVAECPWISTVIDP